MRIADFDGLFRRARRGIDQGIARNVEDIAPFV
jgi:hypothetical protein